MFLDIAIGLSWSDDMSCISTEVAEHCCSIPSLMLGETLTNIARDMDTLTYRVPLGVTAGITPFNFPAMIPLWVSIYLYFMSSLPLF